MTFCQTPPLQPIVPAYRLQVLSEEQLSGLQAATLEILREVGVHCPSGRALQTTMVKQKEVVEVLSKEGLHGKVKVMVGGALVTRDWVRKIGADGYSEDAICTVNVAKHLVGGQ